MKEKYCYDYPRPAVTSDVVALSGKDAETLSVLLIRRNVVPFKEMWALPGGFVNIDEEMEDAAARELEEETGLSGMKFRQIGAFGKVGRDPRHRTVTVAYLTVLSHETLVEGGDDAREARWFPVSDLPVLAFDHAEILSAGLDLWKQV